MVDVGIGDGVAVAGGAGVFVEVGGAGVAVRGGGCVGDGRGVALYVGDAACISGALLWNTVGLVACLWVPRERRAVGEGTDWAL